MSYPGIVALFYRGFMCIIVPYHSTPTGFHPHSCVLFLFSSFSAWMDGRPMTTGRLRSALGLTMGAALWIWDKPGEAAATCLRSCAKLSICIHCTAPRRVMAQVSCELVAPKENRPNEGIMFFNIELSPMASPGFEQGR